MDYGRQVSGPVPTFIHIEIDALLQSLCDYVEKLAGTEITAKKEKKILRVLKPLRSLVRSIGHYVQTK